MTLVLASTRTAVRTQAQRSPSEQHKSKFTRCDHHRRGSQYMENLVMDQPPSHWVNHLRAKLDKRSAAQVTPKAQTPPRDVIELKRIALWHGDKSCISQAGEAAVGNSERPPRVSRIRVRQEGNISKSAHHREQATSSLILHPSSFASPSSAAELP